MTVVLSYVIVRRHILRFPFLPAIPLPFHPRHSQPPKSHQIISFADPHPLTPLQSYRSKNTGGRGATPTVGSLFCVDPSYFPTLRSSAFSASLRYLLLLSSFSTSLLLYLVTSIFRKANLCPQNKTPTISANSRTPAASAATCWLMLLIAPRTAPRPPRSALTTPTVSVPPFPLSIRKSSPPNFLTTSTASPPPMK